MESQTLSLNESATHHPGMQALKKIVVFRLHIIRRNVEFVRPESEPAV